MEKNLNLHSCGLQSLQKTKLNDQSSNHLNGRMRGLAIDPYDAPQDVAFESFRILQEHLNYGTITELETFALGKNKQPVLLIENLPFCYDALPPTPQNDYSTNGKDFLTEYIMLGIAPFLDATVYVNENEKDGKAIQQLIPLKGHEELATGTGSTSQFKLHSENPHEKNAPDYLILSCCRGDANAYTYYLPLDDILYNLPTWVVQDLLDKSYMFRTGPSYRITSEIVESVLTNNNGNWEIRYNSSNDRLFALDEKHASALQYLREFLDSNAPVRKVCLTPGDLLIINNKQCLHGRTSFKMHNEPGRRRWIQRLYLKKVIAD